MREFERIERELLPKFDQVWGVREEDLAVYRRLGVAKAVLTPNVIANAVFTSPAVQGSQGKVVMFGWLAYGPNADAARYLVQLGERAAAAGRALNIALVGRDPEPELGEAARRHAWLQVPGFAPRLQDYVDEAAVIAVPLAWGAGTKLKVLEALAMGKPLVTTKVGAEGLNVDDGTHALIRELGPDFDEAVAAVAADPARFQPMALRGRELAWRHYSQTALSGIVARALTAAR